jgi:hypothetical protein
MEELQVQNQENALEAPNLQGSDLALFTGSGIRFMPRLQLCTNRCDVVAKKKIAEDHFALIDGKDVTDLDKQVDMAVLCYRPKALHIDQDSGDVTACYDPKVAVGPDGKTKQPTGLFKEIADKSEEKDSGCMFGLEFLVWIPKTRQYATFYFGSKTMRNETEAMLGFLAKAATATSQVIETKRYTYTSTKIKACATIFQFPSIAEMNEEIRKFKNPPASTKEKADQAEADNMARPQ